MGKKYEMRDEQQAFAKRRKVKFRLHFRKTTHLTNTQHL